MPRFSGTNNTNGYPYNKPAATKAHVQTVLNEVPLGINSSSIISPCGEALFETPGTYSWVCPTGVTSVCVVCIGGGGGGATQVYGTALVGGAGGGGLGWKNNIPVTPGQSYTVVVGRGGESGGYWDGGSYLNQGNGFAGEDSYFISPTTVRGGGGGGATINSFGAGGTYTGDGGGNGGAGGAGNSTSNLGGSGGAGGYTGAGGAGGSGTASGSNGSGGGGGGTAGHSVAVAGGGGTGLYGLLSGTGITSIGEGTGGGYNSSLSTSGPRGGGGSNPTPWTTTPTYNTRNTLGFPADPQNYSNGRATGGGGGRAGGAGGSAKLLPAIPTNKVLGANGGRGAVRIMWGAGRAFPSTNVGIQIDNELVDIKTDIWNSTVGTVSYGGSTDGYGTDTPFKDATSLICPDGTQGFTARTNITVTGNFTIEFWIKEENVPGSQVRAIDIVTNTQRILICKKTNSTTATFETWGFSAAGLTIGSGTSVTTLRNNPNFLDQSNMLTEFAYLDTKARYSTTWTHIAVTRDGTVYRMFVDGVMKATKTETTAIDLITGNSTIIVAQRLIGKLSNLRIIVGVALYNTDTGFQPERANLTTTQTARKGVQASTVALNCKLLAFSASNTIAFDSYYSSSLEEGVSRTFRIQTKGVPGNYPLAVKLRSTNPNFSAADFTQNIPTTTVEYQYTNQKLTQLLTCIVDSTYTYNVLRVLIPLGNFSITNDQRNSRLKNETVATVPVNNNVINTWPVTGGMVYYAISSPTLYVTHNLISGNNFGRLVTDFTIECWCYIPTVSQVTFTTGVVYSIMEEFQDWSLIFRDGSTSNYQFRAKLINPTFPHTVVSTSGNQNTIYDAWHHVAVVRQASLYSIFINGFLRGSSSSFPTGGLYPSTMITTFINFGVNANMHLSQIRIVDGFAVYPGNSVALNQQSFNPQTTPLKNTQSSVTNEPNILTYSNPSLTLCLLITDGTSALRRLSGNTSSPATYPQDRSGTQIVSATNTTILTTTIGSFPGNSNENGMGAFYIISSDTLMEGLLGGTGSAYAFSYNTGHLVKGDVDISNTDFTIECFIKLFDYGIGLLRGIVCSSSRRDPTTGIWSNPEETIYSFHVNSNDNLEFITYWQGVSEVINTCSSVKILPNVWTHVAVVKQGNSISFYINGTGYSGYSVGPTGNFFSGSAEAMTTRIGCSIGGDNRLHGAISNLRIVRDAIYTTPTITVPTSQLEILRNLVSFNNPLRFYRTYDARTNSDTSTEGSETITFAATPINVNTLPVAQTNNLTILDTSLSPIVVTKNASLPATIIEVQNRASQGWQLFSAITGGLGSNYSYSASSNLPTGLSVNSTGNLVGTPTGALVNITVTVTVNQIPAIPNQTAPQGSANFSIQVVSPLSLSLITGIIATSTTTIFFVSGTSKQVDGIRISGGTTSYTISNISPALPTGLTASVVSVYNSDTGTLETTSRIRITGSSTVTGAATSYTFTVTDTATPSQSQTISVTLRVVPVLTNSVTGNVWVALVSTSITDTTRYESWQMVLGSGGLSPYTYSVAAGTLPTGLTLSTSTGILSGTTPTTTSSPSITFRVTDSSGQTADVGHTIQIVNQLAATGRSMVLYKGMASVSLKDVGGAQSTLLLADNLLVGTPTGGRGTDKAYSSTSTMIPGFSAYLNINNFNLQDGYIDSRYTTAGITGTPATTITSGTSYLRAVKVDEILTYRGVKSGVITTTVNASLIVVNALVATENTNIAQGLTYRFAVGDAISFSPFTSVTGGYGAYSYSMAGSWPTSIGITISATGVISGTLTGTYTGPVSVTVKDAAWAERTVSFQLVVEKPEVYFTIAGTTTWTVPAGVTNISLVGVGGGGGGGGGLAYTTKTTTNVTDRFGSGSAGGGGAVSYINNIAVTPGDVLTIRVGAGGAAGRGEIWQRTSTTGTYSRLSSGTQPTSGGDTTVEYTTRAAGALGGNKLLINAGGGFAGTTLTGNGTSTPFGGSGGLNTGAIYTGVGGLGGRGGNGGNGVALTFRSSFPFLSAPGGGGAGGYTGTGGNGTSGAAGSTTTPGATGTVSFNGGNAPVGGGGGGGATAQSGGDGGGFMGRTSLSGSGGLATGSFSSADNSGVRGSTGTTDSRGSGYGGGGGGYASAFSTTTPDASGGSQGMVRIVWNTTTTRNFPSTNVGLY